jgi:large subunit ribosomal protein L22
VATATDQPTLVRAQVRHLRCSARKARVILDHVRGMSVMQAQATLQFSPRAAARDVLGLLRSATANAKENHDIDAAELVIDHCYADEDRTLKRFKPRARGRASSIHKRMCHVTIVLRHVAVAEARDISAAQATIAAESRRARTRRVPGAAAPAPEAAELAAPAADETTGEETAEPKAAAPKAPRKPRAAKPKATETAESEAAEPEAAAPKTPRKPRAAEPAAAEAAAPAAETAAPAAETSDEDKPAPARKPAAPRKKPAAKPTEPAAQAADDAAEKTADEGDS